MTSRLYKKYYQNDGQKIDCVLDGVSLKGKLVCSVFDHEMCFGTSQAPPTPWWIRITSDGRLASHPHSETSIYILWFVVKQNLSLRCHSFFIPRKCGKKNTRKYWILTDWLYYNLNFFISNTNDWMVTQRSNKSMPLWLRKISQSLYLYHTLFSYYIFMNIMIYLTNALSLLSHYSITCLYCRMNPIPSFIANETNSIILKSNP